MSEDTWGIAGPTFLGLFAVVACVTLIIVLVIRRSLASDDLRQGWEPDAEALAFFAGGANHAVMAALARLASEESVVTQSGALAAVGRPPVGPSALTWAVYQEAQTGARLRSVASSARVRSALEGIETQLRSAGWLLDIGRRSAIRATSLLMFAVAALGAVRVLAGSANGKPTGFIAFMALATFLIGLRLLAAPSHNRLADKAVAQLRTRHAYLNPRSRPSMTLYGSAGAAMAVGLFGAEALRASDPAMADELVRQRLAGSSSYSDSGSSGCGGGDGGGGCGGGGCGG
jgi:uncharacterized protein (TIGR04222 family)